MSDAATQDWRSLESFTFGDSPAMADRLLGFVLEGAKTATCWSVRDGHRAYFTRNGGFAPDMMLWCERFRLVEVIGEGAEQ